MESDDDEEEDHDKSPYKPKKGKRNFRRSIGRSGSETHFGKEDQGSIVPIKS